MSQSEIEISSEHGGKESYLEEHWSYAVLAMSVNL